MIAAGRFLKSTPEIKCYIRICAVIEKDSDNFGVAGLRGKEQWPCKIGWINLTFSRK